MVNEAAIAQANDQEKTCQEIEESVNGNSARKVKPIDIQMYHGICLQRGSDRVLRLFHGIRQNSTIPIDVKIQLAVAIESEDNALLDFLVDETKKAIDADDDKVLNKTNFRLCYRRGLTSAKKIYPLLRDVHYSRFAERCLGAMEPLVYTLLITDFESNNPERKIPALRVLYNLAPKDALTLVKARLKKNLKPYETFRLKLLEARITGIKDTETENLIKSTIENRKKASESLLENRDLLEYYAFTGQSRQLDRHVIPLLKERKRGQYSSICFLYNKIQSPSAEALSLIHAIAEENDGKDIVLFCDDLLKKK